MGATNIGPPRLTASRGLQQLHGFAQVRLRLVDLAEHPLPASLIEQCRRQQELRLMACTRRSEQAAQTNDRRSRELLARRYPRMIGQAGGGIVQRLDRSQAAAARKRLEQCRATRIVWMREF